MKTNKFLIVMITILVLSLVGCSKMPNVVVFSFSEYQNIMGNIYEYVMPDSMSHAFDICSVINKNIISTKYDKNMHEGNILFDDNTKFTYSCSNTTNEICSMSILEFDDYMLNNETIEEYFNVLFPNFADELYENYTENNNFEKEYEDLENKSYFTISVHTSKNNRKEIKLKYFQNIKITDLLQENDG